MSLLCFLSETCAGAFSRIGRCFAFFFVLIYFVQCYYYAVASEFVTTLALENMDQIYLLLTPTLLLLIVAVVVASFFISYFLGKCRVQFSGKTLLICSGFCLFSILFSAAQNQLLPSSWYHASYQLRKVENIGDTPFWGMFLHAGRAAGLLEDGTVERAAYAFEKDFVYDAPEIEKNENGVAHPHPNVIVILTEGTSARLLGCYGGRFDGLTPNFDDFAAHATQVENYFNHTAATFRGTHGQFASCYPKRGGDGWRRASSTSKESFSQNSYQTLPKILGAAGYDTYFISPHAESDPYTGLLNMLGFANIFTRDSAQELLEDAPDIAHDSIRDRDMYRELRALLEHHADSSTPMLVSMYTFETHTQIDTDDKEVSYGDGSNMPLNTLHNVDAAFGEFWKWFQASPYRENTILIVTADHAHYNDRSFLALAGQDADYHSCFVDRIPLLIYDPMHNLPKRYDADDQTSLALTPTVLHLLGIREVRNSFMGESLFAHKKAGDSFQVAALGNDFFGIYHHEVHKDREVEPDYQDRFERRKDEIQLFYAGEKMNAVFRP